MHILLHQFQPRRASPEAPSVSDLLKRHERTCKVREEPEEVGEAPANFQSDQLDQQSERERAVISSCSTRNGDLPDLPSSVDFAALDFLFAPPLASDSITVAERLEYLAYFTSTNGMATFLDRETLKQRQELLRGAKRHPHERIYEVAHCADLLPETIDPSLIDLSSSNGDILVRKAHEITENLHRVITTKSGRTIIKLDWSPAVQESCSAFFSASNIRRFLEYFWSLWYPSCPIVHRPSFDPETARTALLCVMLIIGACLSPHEEDNEAAKMWLDSVEEMTFGDECSTDRETSDTSTGLLHNTAELMKKRVECIQAAYLVCSLQKREGSVEAQGRIRRYRHATLVMLARDIGLESATHRNLQLESPSESWWRQFVIEEELVRTLTYVYLIDAAMAIFHHTPPRMVVSELKMDMACPEACFQADTATECFYALREWEGTIFWSERLSVAGFVRRICQGELDDLSVLEFSKMGTLNLFTTVQALHSLTFYLQNSLVFESTLAPVQTGLENWRRIWNARQPEDKDIPDEPQSIWKKIGFVRYAPEFWHLARIIVARIIASPSDEQCPLPTERGLARFDHTDMRDINGLIMEYRQLNLGVTP
ncbi:hypothetical protein Asppvi_004537 [Aspergillus pseudoviridinutans]|uniref:Xylanolytic transcriptional activator regulatory domain-containing protein n=1 Tax=Aspergillus pseudoviridinutans TaxID=1517512 RepID=A0A9P3ERT7_9EURO|nr:uncharacterized protein Asppvi_004537 [Aspergillus pseudoviridinutans]GIJ85676.1 hypothetical protein Asppvi_004537 [Aspergillus pseudoviridinutans]